MSRPLSTNRPSAFPSPLALPQRICEVHSRHPGSRLEEQIARARRRVTQLQLKIQQETGGLVVSHGRQSSRKGTVQAAGVGPGRQRGQEASWSW